MGRHDHQSIRFIGSKYSNLSHTNDHLVWDPTKLPPGQENVCSEIYNSMDEAITFESFHPLRHLMRFAGKEPEAWYKFICQPGEWVFLPHGQYIGSIPSGGIIRVVRNYGDEMFKGNKLPSRPDGPAKIRSVVPARGKI